MDMTHSRPRQQPRPRRPPSASDASARTAWIPGGPQATVGAPDVVPWAAMNLGSALILGLAGLATYKLVAPSRAPRLTFAERRRRRMEARQARQAAEAAAEPQRTTAPQRVDFGPTPKVVEEICRQWKVGQHRAPWGPAHLAAARGAVTDAYEHLDRPWSGPGQAKQLAFEITADALRRICGEIDIPDNLLQLQDALAMRDTPEYDAHFWFKELWERVYPMAWSSVTGVGDTN
jgi:hypothetical protein